MRVRREACEACGGGLALREPGQKIGDVVVSWISTPVYNRTLLQSALQAADLASFFYSALYGSLVSSEKEA